MIFRKCQPRSVENLTSERLSAIQKVESNRQIQLWLCARFLHALSLSRPLAPFLSHLLRRVESVHTVSPSRDNFIDFKTIFAYHRPHPQDDKKGAPRPFKCASVCRDFNPRIYFFPLDVHRKIPLQIWKRYFLIVGSDRKVGEAISSSAVECRGPVVASSQFEICNNENQNKANKSSLQHFVLVLVSHLMFVQIKNTTFNCCSL